MEPSENPYRAPTATLMKAGQGTAPPVLKLAVGLYLICYALGVALALMKGVKAPLPSGIAWVLLGAFSVFVSIALLRGKRWARTWIVWTTAMLLGFLIFNLPSTFGTLQGDLSLLRTVLRIGVGGLMFAPSVRRWFLPRQRT